jgi:hypothetical protein
MLPGPNAIDFSAPGSRPAFLRPPGGCPLHVPINTRGCGRAPRDLRCQDLGPAHVPQCWLRGLQRQLSAARRGGPVMGTMGSAGRRAWWGRGEPHGTTPPSFHARSRGLARMPTADGASAANRKTQTMGGTNNMGRGCDRQLPKC